MICQYLHRNLRNTKTLKKSRDFSFFFAMLELAWRRLGDVLDAAWALLSALWRLLGDVSGAPLGHLGSFRGIEKGQDGARRSGVHFGCQLGFNLDYRLKRASERSERSARSAGMQCQADRGDAIEQQQREKYERTERGEEKSTTCFEVLFNSTRFPFIAKHRLHSIT